MRTSQFPLVDRIVGDLAQRLDDWRAEGLTYTEIRDRLRDEWDVVVSVETLRRWHATETEAAS